METSVLKEIEDDIENEELRPLSISQQLKSYVQKSLRLEEEIGDLETTLSLVKEEYKALMYNDLSAFFVEHGIKEFKTEDGKVYTLKTYISVKPGNKEEFFGWLRESGNEEFIKKEIVISVKGYDTESLEEVFERENLQYTIQEKVHPQTLNSIVRRVIESGESIPENAVTIESGSFVKLK